MAHRKPFGLILALLTAGGLFASPANAEIHRFGVFSVDDAQPQTMLLDGRIQPVSAADFREALTAFPDVAVLDLHSLGGNVAGGLGIAQEVHARGIDTYVGARNLCYSACAYVFFAGEMRVSAGAIGVHRIEPNTDAATPATFESVMRGLVRALEHYGVPRQVIAALRDTPHAQMRVYTLANAEALGINRGHVVGALFAAPTVPAPPASGEIPMDLLAPFL